MQEAQENLKRAAIEFLDAAETVADRAAEAAADPLDAVSTDVLELGDLEPAIDRGELADLRQQLLRMKMAPEAIVELVALARQVAGILAGP